MLEVETRKGEWMRGAGGNGSIPLLNLMEALEEGDGNEDDNGLLAVADLELLLRVRG